MSTVCPADVVAGVDLLGSAMTTKGPNLLESSCIEKSTYRKLGMRTMVNYDRTLMLKGHVQLAEGVP